MLDAGVTFKIRATRKHWQAIGCQDDIEAPRNLDGGICASLRRATGNALAIAVQPIVMMRYSLTT